MSNLHITKDANGNISIGSGTVGSMVNLITINDQGIVDSKGYTVNNSPLKSGGGVAFKNKIRNGRLIHSNNPNPYIVATNPYKGYTIPPEVTDYRFYLPEYFYLTTTKYDVMSVSINETGAPSDFIRCVEVVAVSDFGTVNNSDLVTYGQIMEDIDLTDLKYGTNEAEPVTVSFWVKTTSAGKYGLNLRNKAGTLTYPTSYTVNQANTWERKTVTIPGCANAAWLDDPLGTEGRNLILSFVLIAGSGHESNNTAWQSGGCKRESGCLNLPLTTQDIFTISGIQLEKGGEATEFEHLPYPIDGTLSSTNFARYQSTWWYATSGGEVP